VLTVARAVCLTDLADDLEAAKTRLTVGAGARSEMAYRAQQDFMSLYLGKTNVGKVEVTKVITKQPQTNQLSAV
jgi:hypothetical protein